MTVAWAMRSLWEWVGKYGIPRAIYADQKNVYVLDKKTIEENNLKGEDALTQFGKACSKLGIEIIRSYSPQGRGRVERKNGLHQDRLIKELKLKNINGIEDGNKFLREYYLSKINEKFSIKPASDINFHVAVPKEFDLRRVFCYEEKRSVKNDWTVRYYNVFYQIEKVNEELPKPKDKVIISKWLDGSIHIIYRGKELKYNVIGSRLEKSSVSLSSKIIEDKNKRQMTTVKRKYKPPQDHPWRKSNYWLYRKKQMREDSNVQLAVKVAY